MRFLAICFGLIIAALAAPADAQGRWHGQGPQFDRAACDPRYCEESDWIYDDNTTNHTTVWRHRMGVTPRFITILFSPDPDIGPVTPLMWPWQQQTTGNPASIEMGNRAVRLHIWAGAPLHGTWRPKGGWRTFRSGYWKIIVYR